MNRSLVAVAIVYLTAIALWMGGLVVLGAIVAPVVFRVAPAPYSADAMTTVFRRFDAVAMTAAVVACVAEASLLARGGRRTRLDVVRGIFLSLATALAVIVGLWLAPGIESLHRAGAIRYAGESGMALERLHGLAESAGKGQLVLLLAVLAMLVVRISRSTPT